MTDPTAPTGHDRRVDRAVENAWFKLSARSAMIFASVVVLPVAGFIGTQLWSDVRATLRAANETNVRLENMTGVSNLLRADIEQTNKTMNFRFDAQGRRIDRLDTDIDDIKRRVYALPTGSPR